MKRIVLVVLVLVVIASGLGWWIYTRLRGDGGARLPTESDIAIPLKPGDLPVLVTLSPGTIVGSTPLSGWSHPVIKTITFVESGDVDTLPAFARKTASRFRTVIVADIRPDLGSKVFSLRRIGVGLCLDLKGQDTVISSTTLSEQGVELGTVDKIVLGRAERALGRSHLAAMTPTFALYDTFVELADSSGLHQSIIMRYGLMVDPKSGELQTTYWTMTESVEQREAPETLTLIPLRSEFQCGIHVKARRVIGSIAASWGFAMVKLPTGDVIPMPPALSEMALRESFGDHSADLEKAVRETLANRVKTHAK